MQPRALMPTGAAPPWLSLIHIFGRQIKFGAYSDYGMHAELLRDLLLFWSATEQKMVTLQEYVDKMPAEQKFCLLYTSRCV